MRVTAVLLTSAALLAALASVCVASAPEDARKVFEANKDAVVTVELVIEVKTTFEGESDKREHKSSSIGTVIDPSGLTVVSLLDVDPTSGLPDIPAEKGSISVQITSAKIRTGDGTEIAGDMVLRDPDLDLAFIRPKTPPAKPMPFVDLANASSPLVLDDLVCMGRLGRMTGFVAGATLERVTAVITKPRLFYAITSGRTGGPVFALDGKAAGIALWRVSRTRSDDEESDWQIVALPAEAVLKAAQQAKTAEPVKPVEPVKPAAPEPTK